MLDVLAVEVGADPLDEFHFAQGAIRFNDGALGVDPLRLDSIQPRTLDRQSADQDSYSAFTLGLPVMGANPGANFLTEVPTGIVPDQQRRLARGRELLADPQQEGGRDMADGATIDDSDHHLLGVGSQDPVTGDGLRLGVLFGEDHLPKSQRRVAGPRGQVGLRQPRPPDLVGEAKHPVRMGLCQAHQPRVAFFNA